MINFRKNLFEDYSLVLVRSPYIKKQQVHQFIIKKSNVEYEN